ncbi:MAG: FAD-binding domain-containing protein [Planctomycetota bacterium]
MPACSRPQPSLPFAGPVQIVWFKRDLRVADHAPLAAAVASGLPVVALYVLEPELLQSPEADRGHWGFVLESLRELDRELRARGAQLTIRSGAMPDVLAELREDLEPLGGIAEVHCHQESGNAITYARDLRVLAWLRDGGIGCTEHLQDGVVRRLPTRDGWAGRWQRRMQRDLIAAPEAIRGVPAGSIDHGRVPLINELGLPATTIVDRQLGGASQAHATLRTFLHERGAPYQKAMSTPVAGWDACSRLSPHLALGTVSLKTVHHELRARQAELAEMSPSERGTWAQSMRSFAGRLRWHCHFMQKLEDEPALEFRNMNRSFDGLRENDFDEQRFAAWRDGRTGYPMVDAVMRCLRHTGWMNFRMRAMLVSFASYHLWLHWREVGLHLARVFVDFEPGIHWSQVQMQSGVTGINTVRIYSPAKQLTDQDPDGTFVKRWVPELKNVPKKLLTEPFRMTRADQDAASCRIGVDYPEPIVEHAAAVKLAKDRIYATRRTAPAREEAQRVYAKHGSRRRPRSRTAKRGGEEIA